MAISGDSKSEKKVRTAGGKGSARSSDRSMDASQADEGRGEGMGQWRRRPRPSVDLIFDYKHIETLSQFLGDDGRIVPARVSRLSRKQQRALTQEIKRARHLALVPLSSRHVSLNKLVDMGRH